MGDVCLVATKYVSGFFLGGGEGCTKLGLIFGGGLLEGVVDFFLGLKKKDQSV